MPADESGPADASSGEQAAGPETPAPAKSAHGSVAARVSSIRALVSDVMILLLIVFLLWAIVSEAMRSTVIIDPIDAPNDIVELGYSANVIAAHLEDKIRTIYRKANEPPTPHSGKFGEHSAEPALSRSENVPDIQVVVLGMSLKSTAAYLKHMLGLRVIHIRGDLIGLRGEAVASPKEWLLTLRSNLDGVESPRQQKKPTIDDLLTAAAVDAVKLADLPHLLPKYFFDQEKREKELKFTQTMEAIAYNRKYARPDRRAAFAQVLWVWGEVLSKQEKFDEAVEKYKETLEYDPDLAPAYNSWGRVLEAKYEKEGKTDWTDVIIKYEEAIARNPYDAVSHADLGDLYTEKLKEYKNAILSYSKAIAIEPQAYPILYSNLCNTLRLDNQVNEARKQCEKSIQMDPKSYAVRFNFGLLLEKKLSRTAESHDVKMKYLNQAVEQYRLSNKNMADDPSTADLVERREQVYKKWAECLHQLGKPTQEAEVYREWGRYLEDKERKNDADEKYSRADKLAAP